VTTVSQQSKSDEFRRAPRERAFITARVSYADGAISSLCTVVQISATGAKIRIDASIALPAQFDIAIPQKSIDCRANLIWRRDELAGVAFVRADAALAEMSPAEYKEKIAALEAANAKLKFQVAELITQVQRLTDA